MKRLVVYFLLIMSIFWSCKRDELERQIQQPFKLPVDYYIHYYDTNSVEISTTHIHLTYHNRLLTRQEKDAWQINGDTSRSHCEYIYADTSRGELARIKIFSNNIFVKYNTYTYANHQLIRIETYDAQTDSLEKRVEFSYQGNRVASMQSEVGHGFSGRIERYTFNGDNLVNIEGYFSSDPATLVYEYDFEFDDKNASKKNILTKDWPFRNQNNRTLWRIQAYRGSGFMLEILYHYSYDGDNYPIRRVKTDANGDTLSIMDMEYNF